MIFGHFPSDSIPISLAIKPITDWVEAKVATNLGAPTIIKTDDSFRLDRNLLYRTAE